MLTKDFWKAALIRAIRTFCQVLLADIGICATFADIDILKTLGTAALATLISILTSVYTGLPEVDIPKPKQ